MSAPTPDFGRLTPEQFTVLDRIREFWGTGEMGREFRIGGYAGTGKTTIAGYTSDYLEVPNDSVTFVAPTGKAAKVLSSKLKVPVMTIHSLMYQPVGQHCLKCPMRTGKANVRCHDLTCRACKVDWKDKDDVKLGNLLLCDESSMIGSDMYDDLMRLQRPVIFFGDHGQLPPVNSRFNLMESERLHARLETVHRTQEGSAILKLATTVRTTGRLPDVSPGDGVTLTGSGFEYPVGDDGSWPHDLLILCGYNKTRCALNSSIRSMLGHPEGTPVPGDRVVCLRNSRERDLVNGSLGTIAEIEPMGGDTFKAIIRLDDAEDYIGVISSEQFGSSQTLHDLPRTTDLFCYAYALTVHKSQGSEADRVVLINEWKGAERARWLYTGVTRARKDLVVVR